MLSNWNHGLGRSKLIKKFQVNNHMLSLKQSLFFMEDKLKEVSEIIETFIRKKLCAVNGIN